MNLRKIRQRRRRLLAAKKAVSRGYGGITAVSKETGVSRTTIAKGIAELRAEERLAKNRVRQKLISSLGALIEPIKGKSQLPLRWTTKSTRCLSEMLKRKGFRVSHMTISRLLHELGYNLSTNRKSPKGWTCTDRNGRYAGSMVISMSMSTVITQWINSLSGRKPYRKN